MSGHLVLAEQSQAKQLPSTEPLLVKIIKESTPEPRSIKIINALMPFLLVLGGAVGPSIGWLLQYKTAKRVRMDEVLAENKIKANSQAYTRMKKMSSMLITEKRIEDILQVLIKDEDWFSENRLFLPGKFPNKWITIRNGVVKLFEVGEEGEEFKKIKRKLIQKIEEAIGEIYKDMGVSEIKVEPLDEKEVKQARANKRTQRRKGSDKG